MKRLSALILAGLLAAPVPAQAQTRLPGTLDFDLLSEATEDGVMEATFRIHNPTENKVEDLQINSRRNDAVSTTEQAQEELAAGTYPYYGASQSVGSIDPGETKEVKGPALAGAGTHAGHDGAGKLPAPVHPDGNTGGPSQQLRRRADDL